MRRRDDKFFYNDYIISDKYNKFWKIFTLPKMGRIEEYEISNITEIEDALFIIKQGYSYFEKLPYDLRNNPAVLKAALDEFLDFYNNFSGFANKKQMLNPISFAERDSLTEENIHLAMSAENSNILSKATFFKDLSSISILYKTGKKDFYKQLSTEARNNPLVLNKVLENFNPEEETNPISFALDGALTENNIRLALIKGNILLIENSPLIKSKLFHKINLELGKIEIKYDDLPDSIKNDDNIMQLYITRFPNYYKNLNQTQRNNPIFLYYALSNCDNSSAVSVNPICYALDGALTENNIRLALNKGKDFLLLIQKDSPFFQSKLFHEINIELGTTEIDFEDLPDFIKNDEKMILSYITKYPSQYVKIDQKYKNNPEILHAALQSYNGNDINPISFALAGALTEENIILAIQKGKIEILSDSALTNNRFFVVECLKRDIYSAIYDKISAELKNDPEISDLLQKKSPSTIVGKPIDMGRSWSPRGYKQTYKYYQAVIGILQNGEHKEEEVRGNSRKSLSHVNGVSNVVKYFANIPSNSHELIILSRELDSIEFNPFHRAVTCTDYNMLIILIEGENAQIFFPPTITSNQLTKLNNLLATDLKDLTFQFLHRGKDYDEFIEPGTKKARDLVASDVPFFIKELKIYRPQQNSNTDEDSNNTNNKKAM